MSGADWRVVAASVCGASHARDGIPCQDAHAWRVLDDGTLAFAVADGAGSAPLADVGSVTAVAAAISALAREEPAVADPSAAVERALLHALRSVALEAARRGADPNQLATTLIVGLAGANGGAAAQIGDGALIADQGEGPRTLTTPLNGEFANETVFLTTPGALATAQRTTWEGPVLRLAAFTDGLQTLALQRPGPVPHPPFFAPLFVFAASAAPATAGAELEAFLSSPRVASRADDDLTLLLAVRGG